MVVVVALLRATAKRSARVRRCRGRVGGGHGESAGGGRGRVWGGPAGAAGAPNASRMAPARYALADRGKPLEDGGHRVALLVDVPLGDSVALLAALGLGGGKLRLLEEGDTIPGIGL